MAGNGAERRIWDIEVEGVLSVDETTSNGPWDGATFPVDDVTKFTLFEQTVNVTDGQLNIRIGQLFQDGAELASDRNAVIYGIVVSQNVIPEPSTLILAALGLLGLSCGWRRRRNR